MNEEEINIEFSKIIREKMTPEEFWEYIANWYDTEAICEIMESWDTGLKREAIDEYNEAHNT